MEIKDIMNKLVEHQTNDTGKYITDEEFKKIVEEKYEEKKAYQYLNLELNLLYSIISLLEDKKIVSEDEIDEKLLELDPETYEKALKRHKLFKLKKELKDKIESSNNENSETKIEEETTKKEENLSEQPKEETKKE